MTASANGKFALFILAAALTGGCANSGFDLSTSSVTPAGTETTALKTDPVCITLANQISTLKSDGTIERLEKAADGKSSKVEIKRAALQKQAELNKANADFQAKCGPPMPKQAGAQPQAPTQATTDGKTQAN
jgi:hypothetical protein